MHVSSAGALTVSMRVEGCDKACGCAVCVCVFVYPARGWRREQTGPPQFSLSIIQHARHTSSDMPERVSISCVRAHVRVCVSAPPCLPEECSSLYLYVCLVITYTLCAHVYRGRWSLKAEAILYLHLLKKKKETNRSSLDRRWGVFS